MCRMGILPGREVGRCAGGAFLILALAVGLAKGELNCKVTSLGKVAADADAGSLVISPDGRHLAYVSKAGNKKRVVADGVLQPEFDDIPEAGLTEAGKTPAIRFSPDSQQVAYVAKIGNGMAVMLDGKPGKICDKIIVGRFLFSPDSKHVAVVSEVGEKNKERVVLDSAEGVIYDYIEDLLPRFSKDSQHLFYIARTGDQAFLIKDGKAVANGASLSNLTFSPDAKRFAYTLRNAEKWQVILDATPGKEYDSIGNNLLFSQDSAHFFYTARHSGTDVIVLDNKEIDTQGTISEGVYAFDPLGVPAYVVLKQTGWYLEHGKDEYGPFGNLYGQAMFSGDGKHLAFATGTKDGSERKMIIDGKEGEHFDYFPGDVEFSADGEHTYYLAEREKQTFAVVDGTAAKIDGVLEFHFSPDGKRSAMSARRGEKFYVLADSKEGAPADATYGIVFSPDSKHLAYLTHAQGKMVDGTEQGGQETLWVDGAAVISADEIGRLRYTDGHLITTVRRGKQWRIRVDGTESQPFDELLVGGDVIVDPPAGFHVLGLKGGEYVRIEGEVPGK